MIFVNEKYLPCFGLINMPLLVCFDILLERERERERETQLLSRVQYIEKNLFLKIIYCILIYLICLVLYFLYKTG